MHWTDAVRALAAAHVGETRDRWSSAGHAGSVHEAIDEIVAIPPARSANVTAAVATAHDVIAADRWWHGIAIALGLGPREVEWLALLAACELDPRLTRVLGYLDDTAMPAPATPASAARIW